MRSSGNGQLACIALTARGNSRTCRKNWIAKDFQLIPAELAVGELEPQRVTAEGPPGLNARDQIPDEGLGGQNVAHRFLPDDHFRGAVCLGFRS